MDDITAAVVESVPELPVTVKMRAGWDSSNIVAIEAGPHLEKPVLKQSPCIPAQQTKLQRECQLGIDCKLKQSVSIPVSR